MKLHTKLLIDLQALSDGTPVPLTPRQMAENLIGLCLGIGAGYTWESNKSFVIKLNPAIPEHRELLPRLTAPLRVRERTENWRGRKITVRDTTALKVRPL
jgi:hypothetical protein